MLYSVYFCIAYIIGILWGLNFKFLSLAPFYFLICIMLVIFIIKDYLSLKKYFKLIIFSLVFMIIGVSLTYIKFEKMTTKYSNGTIICSGTIEKFLSKGSYYNKYIFKNSNQDKMLIYIPNNINVSIDDVTSIKGDFEIPAGQRNRGGYDYAKYLYSQNIYGSIYIKTQKDIEIVDHKTNFIHTIQNSIIEVLKQLFPKEEFRYFTTV